MGKRQLLAEELPRQREKERNVVVSSFLLPSHWPNRTESSGCKAWELQPAGSAPLRRDSSVTVQLLSRVRFFANPWAAVRQASLSIANSWSLLKPMFIYKWCHPTISSFDISFSSHLQSFPGSGSSLVISSSLQVAKVLEFQLQHQSFQWIFRTDLL